ncbi:MAG: hypothetical protein HYY06_06050 [Deltaproteobacteria bacterium]|nr:hypothetical protein [Deltaproteobacteria bacterium]
MRPPTATVLAGFLALLASCGPSGGLESLEVVSRSPQGHWRVELLLETRPRASDRWVARLSGSGRTADLDLPSVASKDGERRVSRRKPRLFWASDEERLLVETIGSGFVMVYLPTDSAPFVCDHRVLSAEDVSAAFRRTPTLEGLAAEVLGDPARPHGRAEQEWVLGRIERAGPASGAGAPLVAAVLAASDALDPARVDRLVVARLRSKSGLPEGARGADLGRLRLTLDRFVAEPTRDNAKVLRRASGVLGALDDRVSAPRIARALEVAAERSGTPLEAAAVVDAVAPLSWLAGRWRVGEAGAPLATYLASRHEVPWKTRVARCLAIWAAVRIGRTEAVVPLLDQMDELTAWSTGGRGTAVPSDPDAERSASWADDVPLGVVLAWAAARASDRRAIAPLTAILGERDLPPRMAVVAARALLSIDGPAARPVILRAPSLADRARRKLLDGP